MNKVPFLIKNKLTLEEKLEAKHLGPHQPSDYSYTIQDGKQKRSFVPQWFRDYPWLTVNTETNKLHCFPCLLFRDKKAKDQSWAIDGFNSLKNVKIRAPIHGKSPEHLNSSADLRALGL